MSETAAIDLRNEQVRDFHEVCDCPAPSRPVAFTTEQLRHRLRMLAEEFFEALAASFATTNQLEAAKAVVYDAIDYRLIAFKAVPFFDALADIDYVVEGTRVEAGVKGRPLFTEVHCANMRKAHTCTDCEAGFIHTDVSSAICSTCNGLGRVIIKSPTGKVLKPDNWTPPDIASLLRAQGYPDL